MTIKENQFIWEEKNSKDQKLGARDVGIYKGKENTFIYIEKQRNEENVKVARQKRQLDIW